MTAPERDMSWLGAGKIRSNLIKLSEFIVFGHYFWPSWADLFEKKFLAKFFRFLGFQFNKQVASTNSTEKKFIDFYNVLINCGLD